MLLDCHVLVKFGEHSLKKLKVALGCPLLRFRVFQTSCAIITRCYTLKHNKVITFAFDVRAFKLLLIFSVIKGAV